MNYVTNPKKRCFICEGREVLTINPYLEEVSHTNLVEVPKCVPTQYVCKNKEECKRNAKAHNTEVEFEIIGGKTRVTKIKEFGKTTLEINYDIRNRN